VSSTLWGLNTTIDLGNAMVGLGGFALAFATWRATSASNKIVRLQQEKQSLQKSSEFRLRWLESLREHISNFKSALNMAQQQHVFLLGATKTRNSDDVRKYNSSRADYIAKAQFEYNFVSLMLNKEEDDHKLLMEIMDSEYRNTVFVIRNESEKIEVHPCKLTDQARKVFKFEWDRISSMLEKGENPCP
jgi:hypothetical protein